MADETALDETRLEQMRGYAEAIRTAKHAIEAVSSELVHASDYILTLLAEVERLRAREAPLVEIAETVADGISESETGDCCFCGWSGYPHEPNCITAKARALLAEGEGQ